MSNLTKEECIQALENAVDTGIIKKDWKVLNRLINEHFDNPPLKKEEIKNGMLVWDNFLKHWCVINLIDEDDIMVTQMSNYHVPFEEGKYFRKKVE